MNSEINYIEDLKRYKKEFNDYLIEVRNEMTNYDENLDSSPWLTLGARSSKLFNLIEKIKMCENKIYEELEENIINNNYELISNVPKDKDSFDEILNNVNLFRNEPSNNNFSEMMEAVKNKYVEIEQEKLLKIRQNQREEKINRELDSLLKYKIIDDAINNLKELESNGKYNYSIFQNIKESYYIVASSLFWEHLSRNEDFQLIDYEDEK